MDLTRCPICQRRKKVEFETCWECFDKYRDFTPLEEYKKEESWHCVYYKNKRCIRDNRYCNVNYQIGYDCYTRTK